MIRKWTQAAACLLALVLLLAPAGLCIDAKPADAYDAYIPRVLIASGVTVSGDRIHNAARMTVSEVLHNAGVCEHCRRFRDLKNEGAVLAVRNVSLSFGFLGSITVTFPVDPYYNGLTLTVAHCDMQTPEYAGAVVENGKVSMTVTKLSPFVVFGGIYDPETGIFTEAEQPEPEAPPRANPFTDVAETDWFYDDVLTAYERRFMTGTSRSTFSPDGSATRGMIATVLYRLAGSPPAFGSAPFYDVDMHQWYAQGVLWASQNGIVMGDGRGRFLPAQSVTRAELAAMLYRFAVWDGRDVSRSAHLSYFPDGYLTPSWARPALSWAVAEGIVSGHADGTLDPLGTASRAEIAAMLVRFA